MATRRPRADTAAAALKAMTEAALCTLRAPAHVSMTTAAEPFFSAIVLVRARDDWNDVDLTVAAQLAQCQADIAEEDSKLRTEGRVLDNKRGTPVMNPRTTVLEQLARREMALMRILRMGGKAAGDPRDMAPAAKTAANARAARRQVEQEDDGLLAT